MSSPAAAYAEIERQVEAIVATAGENDPTRARYLVARAALLGVEPDRRAEMIKSLMAEVGQP